MRWFPPSPGDGSTFVGPVDRLFLLLLGLSLLFLVPIVVLIVGFGIRYRRGSKADRSKPRFSHVGLELTWIIIPFLLSVGVFAWAAQLYAHMYQPPADAMVIHVVGKQWFWEFQHPEGRRELGELHVPVGRPIRLELISEDVIHDFAVPAFRIKQDVLPGRYTVEWFQSTEPGEYRMQCMEYCGMNHALMLGKIIVMDPTAYEQWLGGVTTAPLAAAGEQLFRQYGCSGCHRPEGGGVGPSLVGIYGKPQPLDGGRFAIADDRYIHDSIVLPNRDVVAGYPAIMPSFKGQLSEAEIMQIIAYLQSVGGGR